jgi:hypothetical protein
MFMHPKIPVKKISLALTLGWVFSACGDISQLKDLSTSGDDREDSELNLTDLAAVNEEKEAIAEANSSEILPSTPDEEDSPSFLVTVKDARKYVRNLLGLTSDPIQEFKATMKATRAIATSPEDFKQKIAPAREKLKLALEEQKKIAEANKAVHEQELSSIFNATQRVFLECGADFKKAMDPRLGHHLGKKHEKEADKGKKKNKGRKHKGKTFLDESEKSDSTACSQATGDLRALIPAS